MSTHRTAFIQSIAGHRFYRVDIFEIYLNLGSLSLYGVVIVRHS